MYARVVHLQVRPGQVEKAIKVYRDHTLPTAEKQPGFKAAFLLTDAATGTAMSVSLWESEAALKAGEASGYFEQQISRFTALLVAPPRREAFEVSAVTTKV